jgi:hypothetical protein
MFQLVQQVQVCPFPPPEDISTPPARIGHAGCSGRTCRPIEFACTGQSYIHSRCGKKSSDGVVCGCRSCRVLSTAHLIEHKPQGHRWSSNCVQSDQAAAEHVTDTYCTPMQTASTPTGAVAPAEYRSCRDAGLALSAGSRQRQRKTLPRSCRLCCTCLGIALLSPQP